MLEAAVRRLRDRIAKAGDADFDSDTFDGETATADMVVSAANTLPFMAGRRLVVVDDVEKMSAADLEELTAYAKDPSLTTCLVLVAAKIAKNTRLYKAVDAIGGVFEYAAPKKNQYSGEVVRMFQERGKTVGLDVADALVHAVGHDLQRLMTEVDKVCAFAGEAVMLSRADVAAVVASTAPPSIFEFLDAMGMRDGGKALGLMSDLIASGDAPERIEAMAVRHVRGLTSVRALLDRGMSQSAIAREIGMQDWQMRNLARQAEKFRVEQLTRALRDATEMEAGRKTSRVDARLALERWVLSVCGRAG